MTVVRTVKFHNLSDVYFITKMHKFISNSLSKLKHSSFSNWITEINGKNGTRSCGSHTVSGSDVKNQKEKGTVNKVINFNEMVTERRAQAQRSILVQVHSDKSFTELQKYCSQYGKIIGGHHYALTNSQFVLIEFSSQTEAQQAITSSTFENANNSFVTSPFLWFRAVQNGSVAKDTRNVTEKLTATDKLTVTDGCRPINYDNINEIMNEAENISDQMDILFRSTRIDDLGIRMRFLAARQIEEFISGIIPSARACIFGSSVNGYGKLGCDLDLILQLEDCDLDNTKRLVFQTKTLPSLDDRMYLQKDLSLISGMMYRFLPGISNIRQILAARVPIIKIHHDILDLEVDLSLNNMSGVYMSELLYMFTQIDNRVQPLVYTIRRWAEATGITRPGPGVWISNFSLTCLAIFYLQQLSKPVLPPISLLTQQARPQDKRTSSVEGENVLGSFLRDLNVLKFTKENTDSLSELLSGFFEYYSQMNFAEKAISLNDGQLRSKPEAAAVYLFNPIEGSRNVTPNMNIGERERLCSEARNAAWFLASTETSVVKRGRSDAWGLSNLLRKSRNSVIRPGTFFKSRIFNMDAFVDETKDDVNDKKIKFKNDNVKKEVANIQKKKINENSVTKAGRNKR